MVRRSPLANLVLITALGVLTGIGGGLIYGQLRSGEYGHTPLTLPHPTTTLRVPQAAPSPTATAFPSVPGNRLPNAGPAAHGDGLSRWPTLSMPLTRPRQDFATRGSQESASQTVILLAPDFNVDQYAPPASIHPTQLPARSISGGGLAAHTPESARSMPATPTKGSRVVFGHDANKTQSGLPENDSQPRSGDPVRRTVSPTANVAADQHESGSADAVPGNLNGLPQSTSTNNGDAGWSVPDTVPYQFCDDREKACWLDGYQQRASQYRDRELPTMSAEDLKELPQGFRPWWSAQVQKQMKPDGMPIPVDVDTLICRALQCAPQVLALRTEAAIRETAITEEEAEFDWRAFVESTFDDTSDPVGNTLTTGGPLRYRDHKWSQNGGLRKKTSIGGEFEVAQKSGYQNNNSLFFVPNQQGTSRLALSYTQPLLRTSGRAYNESRIVLANIDTGISGDEFCEQVQVHLLDVAKAYWELYRARAVHLQKQKLLVSAVSIERTLEARQNVDALQRQILRARAASATRRSEIARAEMAIRNAESQLRVLVNDLELIQTANMEVIPQETPNGLYIEVSMRGSMQTALQNRPDISRAIKEMKATSVRLDMAKKDVLPKLDLILSTYVAGLEGDSEVGKAFGNQFDQGEPGYSVGLLFEVPLGNRAAKARSCRRQFEVQKSLHEFHATVEAAMADVELAVREVETSYREMLSKFQSVVATEQESLYLLDRWKVLPGDDRSTSFLLEELLDAQERVADEEEGFVNAQIGYALALINLKRATGTLLQFMDGVSPAPTFPEEPAAPEVDSSRNLPPLPAPAAADS